MPFLHECLAGSLACFLESVVHVHARPCTRHTIVVHLLYSSCQESWHSNVGKVEPFESPMRLTIRTGMHTAQGQRDVLDLDGLCLDHFASKLHICVYTIAVHLRSHPPGHDLSLGLEPGCLVNSQDNAGPMPQLHACGCATRLGVSDPVGAAAAVGSRAARRRAIAIGSFRVGPPILCLQALYGEIHASEHI